jgi:hypothetical protein
MSCDAFAHVAPVGRSRQGTQGCGSLFPLLCSVFEIHSAMYEEA